MNQGESGLTRLIRTATLLFGILAGALVYATFEPRVDATQRQLDNDESMLRSDEVAFAEVPRLRSECDQLAKRYAELFSENPEALFLRELSAVARRHGVTIVSTSLASDQAGSRSASGTFFQRTPMQVELRGRYRNLLTAIADLSLGSAVIDVGNPSIRRDGGALLAAIPITIDEPARAVAAPSAHRAGSP